MTAIETTESPRVRQGDIYRDVEFIEYAEERGGIVEVSKVDFPFIIVLTQDCDLEGDYLLRSAEQDKDQNKFLLSVIVAPLYNFEHFLLGQHLSEVELKMSPINKRSTMCNYIITNQNPRYHYLEFPQDSRVMHSGVIDFKHYFTVTVSYLHSIKETNFVCKIKQLYREDVSQRFASFLSRIGLPATV